MLEEVRPIRVIAFPKIVPILEREITELGYPSISNNKFSVTTEGTLKDCIKLNLMLTTGNRVLFQIATFKAADADQLYTEVNKLPWEQLLTLSSYYSVHSSVKNSTINDTRFANLKVKDAIADRFTTKIGKRPDSTSQKNGAVIYFHWHRNLCEIYLDTSGATIAKHGYRKHPGDAPLMESLASAMILSSQWDRNSHFINPMCGSGTLAIEAALLASNRKPGLIRTGYGFMHIKGYNPQDYESIRSELIASKSKKLGFKIIANDSNERVLRVAAKNAKIAGVDHLIDFIPGDFRDLAIPEGPGVIIFNPAYGERLGELRELESTYTEIGDFLKKKAQGYWGYVFTGNLDLSKKIGLRAKRRMEFLNGRIDCRLLEYELYSGSRR